MQVASRPQGELPPAVRLCGRSYLMSFRRGSGFTLVELLITMAVAIILTVIAVPSFRHLSLSNQLTTASNNLVTAINSARMEAIKRNTNTQFCSNSGSANTTDTLGAACGTQTGAVYLLNTSTTTLPVLAAAAGLTTSLQIKGNVVALRFSGQGLGKQAGTTTPYDGDVADICTSQMSTDNHRIIAIHTGSLIETRTQSGACP